MKLILCALVLAATGTAQVAVAHVNDPVSPGTLGDSSLSLDEAIRVVNTTLALNQLSAAERAQITGTGVPTAIEIDATVTSTVTLQQAPSPLDGPAAHVAVAIRGVGGRPALDATGRAFALRIRTNHADIVNLTLQAGTDGVVADTSVHIHQSRQLLLDDLHFTGQTGAAVRLSTAGASAMTPTMISHSVFRSLATAIVLDDRTQTGGIMCDVEYVTFDGVQRGADLYTDGAGGMMTMCRMWRCKMTNSAKLGYVRRGATATKRSMLMLVGCDVETTGDSIDALGTDRVETAIHIHHSTIRPAASQRAFVVGPRNARIDFHISENFVYGDLDLTEGRLNRRLWAWNNIFRDGVFTVDNEGAPTSFRWNRFEGCTVVAAPGNTGQMKHQSTEFANCTIDGQSSRGTVLLENCYLESTSTTGFVSQQSPAPSPWLAETATSTESPAIGGHVDLTLDLPFGMIGAWQLGVANPRLLLTQEPWRDYAFQSPTLLVPGIYALRTTVRLPVPFDANLVGVEIYAMPMTAPYSGQTHVPAFNLPRGAYLTITR